MSTQSCLEIENLHCALSPIAVDLTLAYFISADHLCCFRVLCPLDEGQWWVPSCVGRHRLEQQEIQSVPLPGGSIVLCGFSVFLQVVKAALYNREIISLYQHCISRWGLLQPYHLSPLYLLIGEGNGNPLQYSCLENSRDRGTWQATVHGAAESWTWLSNLHW